MAVAIAGVDDRGWLHLVRVLVGTALGEELVHRGVLIATWSSTSVRARGVVLANVVAFGAWHVASAWHADGFEPREIAPPAGGAVLFLWARLRFRSVLAPAAGHAINVWGAP